ncbi:MAG: lipoate--protein ligase family protein [Candidatus Bathyarchaeia archaeon]
MWRLLHNGGNDPVMNLAVEEALVRSRCAGLCTDTFRLWRNAPSVVLGCHDDFYSEVDLEACERLRLSLVRRPSGGGAVYHDLGTVNFSLIAAEDTLGEAGDVLGQFRLLSRIVLRGLKLLGIRALFREPNGVFVEGKKVSGMAQYRFYDTVLLHGSILVDSDLEALSAALLRKKFKVENLSVVHQRPLTVEQVEEALVGGFEMEFSAEWKMEPLSASEKDLSQELVDLKYGSSLWNLHGERPWAGWCAASACPERNP